MFFVRLVPAVDVFFYIGHHRTVELRILACTLLVLVVLQQAEHFIGQQQYRHKVEQRHQPHHYVHEGPRRLQRNHGTYHHHSASYDSECRYGITVGGDEAYIRFAIEIVPYYCAICKHEDGCCEEITAENAKFAFHCMIGEKDSVKSAGQTARRKNDECWRT